MEVCSLSSGIMLSLLNPYPSHYKMAFAFSTFLYLLFYGHPLRFGFPKGKPIGSGTLWVSFRVDTCVT